MSELKVSFFSYIAYFNKCKSITLTIYNLRVSNISHQVQHTSLYIIFNIHICHDDVIGENLVPILMHAIQFHFANVVCIL